MLSGGVFISLVWGALDPWLCMSCTKGQDVELRGQGTKAGRRLLDLDKAPYV